MILEDFEGHKRVSSFTFEPSPTETHLQKQSSAAVSEKRGWLQRLLRSSSNNISSPIRAPNTQPRHKRSVSDVAHQLMHSRRDTPRIYDLQTMVRVSGKSVLYLPAEHAPAAIVLPTCLRATAQHIAHSAMTRGIFRIPGSTKIVGALFDYYCLMEGGAPGLAGTVRCANLPLHIESSVRDVASTFKRLLSVLPGGILGSLAVFDAMVAIHSQLQGDPEFPRTKQTKVRARLMALAIGTIKSHFRRELICAVFGLLSLIGRIAEITPREDENGRPLPTADLMGYGALGIVFGPLLVGDLLDQYSMRIATPDAGLMLFPISPHKIKVDKRKSKSDQVPDAKTNVNKVLVANSVTEMLITNWRDVVRQMKALGSHAHVETSTSVSMKTSIRPSASENFVIKKPQEWDRDRNLIESMTSAAQRETPPATPTLGSRNHRPKMKHGREPKRVKARPSAVVLSPPVEEDGANHHVSVAGVESGKNYDRRTPKGPRPLLDDKLFRELDADILAGQTSSDPKQSTREEATTAEDREEAFLGSPPVSLGNVPPRTSSKPRGVMARQTTRQPSVEDLFRGESLPQSQDRGRTVSKGLKERRRSSHDVSPITVNRRTRPRYILEAERQNELSSSADPSRTQQANMMRQDSPTHASVGEHADRGRKDPETEQRRDQGAGNDETSHEYFYLSPNGDLERLHAAGDAEQVDRDSIGTTPRHFYATMQTPASLPKQRSEHHNTQMARTGT